MLNVIKSLSRNMSVNFKRGNSLIVVTADHFDKDFYTVVFKEKLSKSLLSGKKCQGYSFLGSKCMSETNLIAFLQARTASGFALDTSFEYLD